MTAAPASFARTAAARLAACFVLAIFLAGCTVTDGPLVPPRPIPGSDVAGTPLTANARPTGAPAESRGVAVRRTERRRRPPTARIERRQLPPPPQPARRRTVAAPPASTSPRTSTATQPQAQRPLAASHSRTPQRDHVRTPASAAPARKSPDAIRFTPVVGAPEDAIRPLSSALEAAAERKNLVIRNDADEPVDSILRGYFSATRQGGTVRIEYVWDVLDGDGNRLHRLQGHESVAAGKGDIWGAGRAATMRKIARETIADYLAWRQRQTG